MIEPGPAGNSLNESGSAWAATVVCPGNSNPGSSPLSGATTDCVNRTSSVCDRLARLVNVCCTRATCPPSASDEVWLISIPAGVSDGQLEVVGGNVPGAAQNVGMSASAIATVVCSALKTGVYWSGWDTRGPVGGGPGGRP